MLRALVSNRREEVWQVDALNEFLVGGSTRTLTLDISIDGFALGTVRGDGIIVATRTGSTAYAMSAGGPVVTLESMILVTSNAILVRAGSGRTADVHHGEITNATRLARPYVIADGQKDYQIEQAPRSRSPNLPSRPCRSIQGSSAPPPSWVASSWSKRSWTTIFSRRS